MNSSAKKIAICITGNKTYSETFIKAHIDLLKPSVLITRSMIPYLMDEEHVRSGSLLIRWLKGMNKKWDNYKKEKQLKKILAANNIGVILAEYGQMGVDIMPICKKYNIPLVVHFHGFDAYKKEVLTKYVSYYQEMFEFAKAIVVVSTDMQKQLLALGAKEEKVFYNVYGVDVDTFKISSPMNTDQNLLFVGRFVEKKAPYLALIAFSKVLKEFPEAKFNMVGDGPLLDVCRNMAFALGIIKNVNFLGIRSHKEVSELMQHSRAYIQHSIVPDSGDSEGTPNSVLEAMASALPVISTNHAGIKDVVIHSETGFLVDEKDVDSMSEYMRKLLKDPILADQMGQIGRKRVVTNYTMAISINKLLNILENFMK
ncbi:MAG: glycosyltransferase family 4 protein [Bacteroidetes bacterium]|nr:glycosyltransferase family 4 protein [Bacteroidota bacterium]